MVLQNASNSKGVLSMALKKRSFHGDFAHGATRGDYSLEKFVHGTPSK